jgi:hypothetical protein
MITGSFKYKKTIIWIPDTISILMLLYLLNIFLYCILQNFFLCRFFKEIAPEMADFDSPFDTLAILSEVVASDDEMLSLGRQH